jgi:hypothetical protein
LSVCLAQESKLPESVSLHASGITIEQALKQLSDNYPVSFYFSSNKIPTQQIIHLNMVDVELPVLLNEICRLAGIAYKLDGNQVILYLPDRQAQKGNVTLSGYVEDSKTGERLIGAFVFFPDLMKGISTNAYGFYSFTLSQKTYKIKCSYIGYETVEKSIEINADNNITFSLIPTIQEIKPVTLESSPINRSINLKPGTDVLPASLMRTYPALLGENDIVQFLKMLPGVSTNTEGMNGLYVRGCLPQHTSFIIDEAPMFNMFHFSGWFSTINPDAVKEVKLYKSHLPANQSGALASIADIRLRDGNNQHYNFTGGIGTITSRLTIEGPIIRNRSSFIISGRRSYLDQMIKLFSLGKSVDMGKLYFYDLNAKINYTLNAGNRLYLSSYAGKDVIDSDGGVIWNNSLLSVRWNHLFSEKLFSNLTLTGSWYNHSFKGYENEDDYYRFTIGLRNYNFKYDLAYYTPSNNRINFGLSSRYFLLPRVDVNGNLLITSPAVNDKKPYSLLLTSAYLQGEFNLSDKWSADIGFRCIVADKIHPDDIDTRVDPEPVASLQYSINKEVVLKGAYSRNHQYYHGANVFDLIIPFDKYILSGSALKPQYADHFSAGIYYSPEKTTVDFSIEPYISLLRNQYRIPINTDIYFNRDITGVPVTGKLNVFGTDVSIRKLSGKITGMISYTWLKSFKKEAGINQGQYYQPYYDRRHDLVISINYQFSKRVSFASNWVYMSGNPYSLPVGKYELRGRSIPLYDNNTIYNRHMPDYHRLDVSTRLGFGRHNPPRHSITFMIYNLYARKNPVFYHYSDIVNGNPGNNPNSESGQRLFSMLGYYFFNVFPAFSYEFKFGQ